MQANDNRTHAVIICKIYTVVSVYVIQMAVYRAVHTFALNVARVSLATINFSRLFAISLALE